MVGEECLLMEKGMQEKNDDGAVQKKNDDEGMTYTFNTLLLLLL